jgi:subtilisin family serine protease
VIDEEEIYDLDFHGTFVSGLISSNGLGMASVAPDASIMAVKVLNCSGTGSFSDIIDGIAYAAQADADVINMSLGAYFSRRDPGARSLILALQRAVLYATLHGSTVVAAAGNDGVNLDRDGDFINVPSQLLGVVSVGATAPVAQVDFDALASYTNYGFTGVTLMAPGGDLVEGGICGFAPDFRCDLVLSALSSFVAPGPNFYAASGGTSFASPHVAGALAVVESARGSGPASVVCVLRGADDLGSRGFDAFYGLGRLNVVGALGCRGGLHAG